MRLSDLHKRVLAKKIPVPPILDLFPNAAAAYSLRKLRSAYTGNCIEVRRSSDNALQNIGFVNNLLDTASLLSFVGAGNGFVSTWYDQSGQGKDAAQTTNDNQPQIVISGNVNKVNNKNSIFFNSVNSNQLVTPTITANQPTTQFGVGKIIDGYSLALGYTFASSTILNNRQHFFYRTTGKFAIFAGIAAETVNNSIGGQLVFSALFNGNNSILRRNNNQIVSGNAGTQSFGGQLTIGSQANVTLTWNGDIQEFIFYPNNLSNNFNEIESNINSYYNIF
jgi:hypothetical protein